MPESNVHAYVGQKNFNFMGIFAASTDWARQGVHVGGDQIQVTREKMEQLRRIMEERKAKRRARREARAAPYSTSWSLKSSSTASSEVDAELANLQVKMIKPFFVAAYVIT